MASTPRLLSVMCLMTLMASFLPLSSCQTAQSLDSEGVATVSQNGAKPDFDLDIDAFGDLIPVKIENHGAILSYLSTDGVPTVVRYAHIKGVIDSFSVGSVRCIAMASGTMTAVIDTILVEDIPYFVAVTSDHSVIFARCSDATCSNGVGTPEVIRSSRNRDTFNDIETLSIDGDVYVALTMTSNDQGRVEFLAREASGTNTPSVFFHTGTLASILRIGLAPAKDSASVILVSRGETRRIFARECVVRNSALSCDSGNSIFSDNDLTGQINSIGQSLRVVSNADGRFFATFIVSAGGGSIPSLNYVACTNIDCSGSDRTFGVVVPAIPPVGYDLFLDTLIDAKPVITAVREGDTAGEVVPVAIRCESFTKCDSTSTETVELSKTALQADRAIYGSVAPNSLDFTFVVLQSSTNGGLLDFVSTVDPCTDICGDGTCTVTNFFTASCLCPSGFQVSGGNCVDIDECQNSPCSQQCINSAGSFSCACNAGFILDSNGTSCLPDRCPAFNIESGISDLKYTGCPETIRTSTTGNLECNVKCADPATGTEVTWLCQPDGSWSTVEPFCMVYDPVKFATADFAYDGPEIVHNGDLITNAGTGGAPFDGDEFFLNPTTGVIRATFTTDGSVTVQLALTKNAQPNLGSQTLASGFDIAVSPAMALSGETLTASAGQPFTGVTPGLDGGRAPIKWSLASGTLPTGLEVVADTGQIKGTPEEVGLFEAIIVIATDDNGATIELEPISLRVVEGLQILGWDRAEEVPDAVVGIAYTLPAPEFSVRGNSGDVSFSLAGRAPAGLFIDPSTGDIVGNPQEAVTETSFTVVARDDTGNLVSVENIKMAVRPPNDCDVAANGPNGRGCAEGTCFDAVAFDESFTCNCTGELIGDNCDVQSVVNQGATGGDSGLSTPVLAAIGTLGGLLMLALIIIAIVRRKHIKERNRAFDFKAELEKMAADGALRANEDGEKKIPREIPRRRIKMTTKLGAGQFGDVFKGTVNEADTTGVPEYLVAVKTLKNDPSGQEKIELMREACIMAQFNHINVVNIVGVCTRGMPLMIIVQFCEHGALNSYLKNKKEASAPLSVAEMTRMSADIATGMEYLSSAGLVHRDLAARNVLLDSHLTCKVADFGLSRDLEDDGKEYYRANTRGMIPVRWTAIEALEDRKFSMASDVWSFGITMYEIFTYAEMPYGKMSNQKVWMKVKVGYRLPRPANCPEALYDDVMLPCWHDDPSARPSFTVLRDRLENVNSGSYENHPVAEPATNSQLMPEDAAGYVALESPERPATDPVQRPSRRTLNLNPPKYIKSPEYVADSSSTTDGTLRRNPSEEPGAYEEPVPLDQQSTAAGLPGSYDMFQNPSSADAPGSYDMFDSTLTQGPVADAGLPGEYDMFDSTLTQSSAPNADMPGAYDAFEEPSAGQPGEYDMFDSGSPGQEPVIMQSSFIQQPPDQATEPMLYA